MSFPIERKLPVVLSFVFLMLAAIGFLLYKSTVSFQESRDNEKRSQAVIANLDDIVTSTADIETATSGFIALGNDTYLEPSDRAKVGLKKNIAELRTLLANDNSRVSEMDGLESLVKQKISYEENKVELRRQNGYDNASYLLGQMGGIEITRQIRVAVDKLKDDEIASQQFREQGLDLNLNLSILILILSSFAGIAALIAAYVLVVMEIRKRRGAEESLVDVNKGLETRIEERTAELQAANRNLLESAGERETLLVNEQSARKEAEVANRLRDEFMATISHELRTPLNSILGWARLLKSGDLDAEKREKAINTIVKNSETQNRLIEDLLDAARIISGKLEIEHDPVNFEEVVMHSIETIRPSAEAKSISIGLEIESDESAGRIIGDRDRLQQVVCNLLTNAVKFTPHGGKVAVGVNADNGFTVLNVSDTGAGINAEFLPDVFERFRQDKATIKQSRGLGLGLAVVRNLVQMHGGSVQAASDGENQGSTFTVRLPRRVE
jgi:signal transduction histidine kinase